MAEVCRAAGCALLGGETAELPGIYRDDELDFAGTCVGVVERDRLIDGSKVGAGDVVIGLPSAGVHANGFTLVRRILEREDYDGDDLLAPTRLYLDDVRRLREHAHAFAHVTGGGDRGQPSRACSPTGSSCGSTGTPGSGRPSSSGSPGTPRSRSCAASSTSGSATARSCPPGTDGLVIGRRRSDRRARLRRGLEPPGADRRRAADRRGGVEPARTLRALARAEAAGIPTAVFPLDELREPRGARRGDGRLARRARSRAGSCSRATCTCCGRRFSTGSPSA